MKKEDLYNRAGYLTFLVTLALNLVFFVYIALVHPGVEKNPGVNSKAAQSK